MAYDAFHVTVFKSLRSHLSTLETKRFQTSPLSKPFWKVSLSIGVFERSNVDDRRKHIKKYAFLNENALMWMGPKSAPSTHPILYPSQRSFSFSVPSSRLELVPQLKKDGTPQTRTPSRFALFVKENFARVKKDNENFSHQEVMKALSSEFAKLST